MVFSLVLCRKPELYNSLIKRMEGFGWFVHISRHTAEADAWLSQLKSIPVVFVVADEEEYFKGYGLRLLEERNIGVVRVNEVEEIVQ